MELKKGQKHGRHYTTQKKTNLIQKEYTVHLFHTLKWYGTGVGYSSCYIYRLVFFCVV